MTQTEEFIQKHTGRQWTDEQLKTMSPKRLLSLLKSARARRSSILHHWGRRCCEYCHEYLGTQEEWDRDIRPAADAMDVFIGRLKSVLSTKPHVPRRGSKRGKTKA